MYELYEVTAKDRRNWSVVLYYEILLIILSGARTVGFIDGIALDVVAKQTTRVKSIVNDAIAHLKTKLDVVRLETTKNKSVALLISKLETVGRLDGNHNIPPSASLKSLNFMICF